MDVDSNQAAQYGKDFGSLIKAINERVTSGTPLEGTLDFIFSSLEGMIPYDRLGIALIDQKNENISLKWAKSKIPIQHLKAPYSAKLRPSSLKEIVESGKPRIINDLVAYLESHPTSESTRLVIKDGIRSSLTCPLIAASKTIGVVFFSSCTPHTYENVHIENFLRISGELSVLVEHALLKENVDQTASKAKSLRTAIHDLRSPLSVIEGFLDIAAEEDWYQEMDPSEREIFSVVRRNTRYMFGLLDQLSTVNSLDDAPMKMEKIELRDFLASITSNARFLFEAKDIEFTFDAEYGLPDTAEFNALNIRRVINNLLTNALKFSERGTKVHLMVGPRNGFLEFTVTDQGPGIPENEQWKLFKEFGKTSRLPTEGESSSGLGLAIAKRIVEAHGGTIGMMNGANGGAIFNFRIPVHPVQH